MNEPLKLRVLRYFAMTRTKGNIWSKPSTVAINLGGSVDMALQGAPDIAQICRDWLADKCLLRRPNGSYQISSRGLRVLACIGCALEDAEIFGERR